MAPQAMLTDFSDPMDKSDKELLHEELQFYLAKVLKACTRHRLYALPTPESLDDKQGTEDTNLLLAVETVEEILAVAESQIAALKWDLVEDMVNPGVAPTQAFKKACYIRHEHLLADKTSSLLSLANMYEQREKFQKHRGDGGVELVLPSITKRRRATTLGNGLFANSSPAANIATATLPEDESLLKKVNYMKTEDMAMELRQRGVKVSKSKGNKAELMSRLKAARCEAYRSDDAIWADQLTDTQFETLAKLKDVDIPKQETREDLKGYLYDHPDVKVELEAELAKISKFKKAKPGNKLAKPQYPELVTTTEEPLRLRRLLLRGYPAETTEQDILALMRRYGVLTPIQQGLGEFYCDCDTAQNAKQAIRELRFHLVGSTVTRCVLLEEYHAEKRQEAGRAKAAAEKEMRESSVGNKRKADSESTVEENVKKAKNE